MDLSVSDAPVGRLLDGRYRIEATVARGGMATVYRALDTRLDRRVALKVMHPDLAIDAEFVDRFIREARAAAKLSHPNVVGVFDQGEDDGVVFLSMEYVEGRTLRHTLRDAGRLSPAQALETIEPVLTALATAHEAGIVHCDVKPENVLAGDNGRIKVADFGLAKALADPAATQGPLLGTVNYISPEQALGEPATPRSDVYAAGVLLYELLTGEPPHAHPNDEVVVRNHIDRDVPPPSLVEPDVPLLVDEIVRRATARDPYLRFASAAALAEAVQQVRDSLGEQLPGLESRESAGVSVDEVFRDRALPADDRAQRTTMLPAAGRAATAAAPLAPPISRRGRRARPSRSPLDRTGEDVTRQATTAGRAGTAARADVVERPGASGRAGRGGRMSRRSPRWRRTVAIFALFGLIGGVIAGAWWLGEGRYVRTPSFLNMTVEEAQAAAAEAGVRVRIGDTKPSETFEAGLVMETNPGPNERVLRGFQIALITSSGPSRVTVPEVRGIPVADAIDEIEAAGLAIAEPKEEYNNQVDEGYVIDQDIPGGQETKPDTPVLLTVSLGREQLEITNYTGREAEQAEEELSALGFDVQIREQPHGNVPQGLVISQEPSGGIGHTGDTVTLVVATTPSRIEIPNVLGWHVDDAVQHLTEAGFTNIELDERPSLFPQRVVTRQDPRPGREVRPDREIKLQVR